MKNVINLGTVTISISVSTLSRKCETPLEDGGVDSDPGSGKGTQPSSPPKLLTNTQNLGNLVLVEEVVEDLVEHRHW